MKPRRLTALRWLVAGLWASGLALFGAGCVSPSPFADQPPVSTTSPTRPSVHLTATATPEASSDPAGMSVIQQVSYAPDEEKKAGAEALPEPRDEPKKLSPIPTPAGDSPVLIGTAAPPPMPGMPPGLDMILQLTEQYNPCIAQAREKVRETGLDPDLNAQPTGVLSRLIPSLGKGEATVKRLEAQRRQIEARAQLVEVTQKVLLDAGSTYVDLQTVRRTEIVVHDAERLQAEMLQRAEKLAEEEPIARILVDNARAEIATSRQTLVQLTQQEKAAAAKLAYLLGAVGDCTPIPSDSEFHPYNLVDLSIPVEALVAQVKRHGPGVHELCELLGVIQKGIDLAEEMSRSVSSAKDKRDVALSKKTQAQLALRELQNKLALGVREGRETILASQARFTLAAEQIAALVELYRLSREALLENLPSTKISDVLLAIRSLRESHTHHIQTIQNHNKAQIRLFLLLSKECK